jgi:GNAT superfamily N-acetyltransferase
MQKQVSDEPALPQRVFREAKIDDIRQIQIVRHSVTENILSDPGLVTDEVCLDYITNRGKGWVCEIENRIVGFAIADLKGRNIWALFVHPQYDRQGIGKQLHNIMLNWYFDQTSEEVWLGTTPGTRAEIFYRKMGWKETGSHGESEVKFEMTRACWRVKKAMLWTDKREA